MYVFRVYHIWPKTSRLWREDSLIWKLNVNRQASSSYCQSCSLLGFHVVVFLFCFGLSHGMSGSVKS